MMRALTGRLVLATSLMLGSATVFAATNVLQVFDSSAGKVALSVVAEGLRQPWGLAFLPDGRMLVTEKNGRLRVVAQSGALSEPVAGVPEVHARGQGGLLDVALSPQFTQDGLLYLSYAEPTQEGARTAVARARLDLERLRLEALQVIFRQNFDPGGGHHWGSRLVFGRDGMLYITTGDRGSFRHESQSLASHLGKVIRIAPDGSVPPDNPFVGRAGAMPEIWSYGHRNMQGAALHPQTGVLWTHEHGPQGGDEVNVVQAGGNYGWPVITYGKEYGLGLTIGEGTERPDIVPAVKTWVPSIAPSGMAFYTGDAFPAWRGSLFVGALKAQLLVRLGLDGERVSGEERLLADLGARIRDVRQGPDGFIYLLDESRGRILRLQPGE